MPRNLERKRAYNRAYHRGERWTRPTAKERFWPKVAKTDGCWLWTASLNNKGYGEFRFQGRTSLAHRVAYELLIGPIPEGLSLDHLCRNPRCVNPAHLEPVTHQENMRRTGPARIQAHCLRGHELKEPNLYVSRRGARSCRACALQRAHIQRLRKKALAGLIGWPVIDAAIARQQRTATT
jgi:hypothetical protein